MTSPDDPEQQRSPLTDGWRSWWLMALTPVALGAVILAAEATNGELASGLGWFAVLAAFGAILAFGGRFDAVRQARGDAEDERDGMINLRAMAAAGQLLVLVLTGLVVYALASGDDPRPYTQLMAVGGAGYAVALLVLWRRS
jgi:Na+/melibiose symporter-like transporter